MRNPLLAALFFFQVALMAAATELPAQITGTGKGVNGAEFQYQVYRPTNYDSEKTYPVVLISGVGADSSRTNSSTLQSLGARGWVVVVFRRSQHALLPHLIGHLRRTYRIETQRFFLPLSTDEGSKESRSWFGERPTDFHRVEDRATGSLAKILTAARKRVTSGSIAERAVATVLDDFHDCASKADGPRYFGHFAPQGVFLGTDPTERWPQAEFRAWGSKYFERDSAWIYVPQVRHVDVVGDLAWFDESLHSDSYGVCRGTGALQKIDGVWKIAQYHLSVPVPNDLMGDLVAMIRDAANQSKVPGMTTVFVVRHAEKILQGKDPLLTEVGRARAERLAKHLTPVKIGVCYTTQFKRTQKTVAPTCKSQGIGVTVLDAKVDVAAKVLASNRGQTVLIAGHSNTVPNILRRLGVRTRVRMTESDYSDLFVVRIEPGGKARLLRLHY